MTADEKERIKELRLKGMGYKGIVNLLELTRDSVRGFCSDECRRKWWRENQRERNKSDDATYQYRCPHCGKELAYMVIRKGSTVAIVAT